MGYRTTETVSEQISERVDGEAYIPILPSTLDDWARIAKMLEANLAHVEGLLDEYKNKIAQLEATLRAAEQTIGKLEAKLEALEKWIKEHDWML